jgi:hypothetical protein
MQFPAPFSPEFLEDIFYAPDALFLDRIESMSRERSEIICRMPTDQVFPLTTSQRGDERLHPRHVAAGIIVHVTGMVGWAHAYHLEGLRHHEGWAGFGTRIHNAAFRKMVTLGPPLFCKARAKKTRNISGKLFTTYEMSFEQEGQVAYESEQSAIWFKGESPVQG